MTEYQSSLTKEIPHPTTMSTLLQPSTKPKNTRFHTTTDHRYPLRSRWKSEGTNFKGNDNNTILSQHLFASYITPQLNHIYREDGKRETIDSLIKGANSKIWIRSLSNEWGRLAQGNTNGVHFNDVIDFIEVDSVCISLR